MDGTTFNNDSQEVIPEAETFSNIFTSSIVQDIAKRSWHRDVQVVDYKLKLHSDEKLGFSSLHRSMMITVQEGNRIESRTFFVKLALPKTDLIANFISRIGIFEKEALFYNEIFPLLQKEYQAEAWGPQCYYGSKEVIVLEDLRIKGFRMSNKILDKAETMTALSAIARMHAASLLAEKRLGKSLLEVCPGAFDVDLYHSEDGARFKWLRAGVETTVGLAQHFGLNFSGIPETFAKLSRIHDPSPSKHNVVSHLDIWTNNLMFDDSSPTKCLLLDYQMVRYCPMAADFTMFLHLCTSRDFRERYKLDMMNHYYNILYHTMKSHDSQITVPEWSEFGIGVEEYTLSGAAYAILNLPLVLMDGKTLAEVYTDIKTFVKFMTNRKEAVLVLMRHNSIYNERIGEALLEFVEMSQRLD